MVGWTVERTHRSLTVSACGSGASGIKHHFRRNIPFTGLSKNSAPSFFCCSQCHRRKLRQFLLLSTRLVDRTLCLSRHRRIQSLIAASDRCRNNRQLKQPLRQLIPACLSASGNLGPPPSPRRSSTLLLPSLSFQSILSSDAHVACAHFRGQQ